MYEDILEPSKQDLKDKLKEFQEVLKQSRDYINDRHIEIDVLKNFYHDAFEDAKRFSKHIKNLHERIIEKDLQDDFSDLEVPK